MRFSLGLKFGLLLAGFVAVLSTLVLLGFSTARRVASELDGVKDHAFPQFAEATYLTQATFVALFKEPENIVLRHAARDAAAVDLRDVDAVLFRDLADQRRRPLMNRIFC